MAQVPYRDVYNVSWCCLVIHKLDGVPRMAGARHFSLHTVQPCSPATLPRSSQNSRKQRPADIAAEESRFAISSAMVMRIPESLERVQTMVCEFCWLNIFNTENFERLGRLEDEEFTYHVSILSQGLISAPIVCQVHYSDVR